MIIKVGSVIEVENTLTIQRYCAEKLVLDNPEYKQKVKMNLWIGKTPKTLNLFTINGAVAVLPFGCLEDIKAIYPNAEYEYQHQEHPIIVKTIKDIELYPYQKKALGVRNGILIAPAGSGKTTMAVNIIKEISQKTLWLTHTVDLLEQSKKRFKECFSCSVGEITAGKVNIQDVTFATIQTISNIDLALYKDAFGLVVIDECHRIAGSPTKLTMFYKVINNINAAYKLGLTATSHRSDGMIQAMYSLIGNVSCEIMPEAVGDKTIKAEIMKVTSDLTLDRFSDAYNSDGTINFSALINEIAEDSRRNELIVSLIDDKHSYLVLSDRIFQLEALRDILGVGVVIDGKTKKATREKAIQDMRDGKEKVLFASYSLAKEGLDIPCLSRLVMATPKKDLAVIVQSVGRIERSMQGKGASMVFDIVDENISICRSMSKSRDIIYRKNNNKAV